MDTETEFSCIDDTDDDPTFVPSCDSISSEEEIIFNKKRRFKKSSVVRRKYLKSLSKLEPVKETDELEVLKDTDRVYVEIKRCSSAVSFASSGFGSCESNAGYGISTNSKDEQLCDIPSAPNYNLLDEPNRRLELKFEKCVKRSRHELYKNMLGHQKSEDLNININWDVPIHQQSFACCMDDDINESFGDVGLARGVFTEQENNIIIGNWNNFTMEYGFNNPELFFPHAIQHSKCSMNQRWKFVQYLCKRLPNRTMRSVYRQSKSLLCKDYLKGRFTFLEDKLIMDVMNGNLRARHLEFLEDEKRDDWSNLVAAMLKRFNRYIVYRYERLRKYDVDYNIDWSKEVCAKIIEELLQVCNVNCVQELLRYNITRKKWEAVSKSLGYCSVRLEALWLNKLSIQLAVQKPIYRNKLRRKIICWLYNRRLLFEGIDDVEWIKLCEHVNVPSPWCLYRIFRKMLFSYVPQHKLQDFLASIKHLHQHFLPILQSGILKDYRLTRLVYTHGVLKESS